MSIKPHHTEETLAMVDKQHQETFAMWWELQNIETAESAAKTAWRESRELYKLYLENATTQIAGTGTVKQAIENLFDAFFDFPTGDRTHVTSFSCKLFAQHVAEIVAKDFNRRASPKPLTDEQTKQGMKEADPSGEDLCRWSFKEGVTFSERAHGIGAGE